jgi:hypothetical protein
VDHIAGLATEVRSKILCFCWGSNPSRRLSSGTVLIQLPQLLNKPVTIIIIIIIIREEIETILFFSFLFLSTVQFIFLYLISTSFSPYSLHFLPSSSFFILSLFLVLERSDVTHLTYPAGFVSHGTCQFRFLQNRGAHVLC